MLAVFLLQRTVHPIQHREEGNRSILKLQGIMSKAPPSTMIAGTLQTDPRSGGIKRSSGVNVLPIVAEGTFYF